MSSAETQRLARVYAVRGWRVFPVVVSEKRPMFKGWQADCHDRPDDDRAVLALRPWTKHRPRLWCASPWSACQPTDEFGRCRCRECFRGT